MEFEDWHPQDTVSREYFWGCELNKEKEAVTWTFTEEEEDRDFLSHILYLKHAVLGPGAEKGERNIVQVETKNFDGEEVKQPVLSLTVGVVDMCTVDHSFDHTTPVTFRLVEGKGPVFLSAQHCVELPGEEEELAESEYESEGETEATGEDEEEESPEKPVKASAKKRKATTPANATKSKRSKPDAERNGDESMDADEGSEEDEEDEVDEDEDESEATEETEEEEEDEDEEEEDEESPEKEKKVKSKGKKKGKMNGTSTPSAGTKKTPKGSTNRKKISASAKKGKKGKK